MKNNMKALTIRLDEHEYKIIMKKLIDKNEKSFQQYVLKLIYNDLNIQKKK